jgi:uncharacterized protein with GYD domain
MSTYIASAKYSNDAFKGMVANPQDREAAARALFDAVGIKMHQIYFGVNEAEIVVVVEGTPQQMAAIEMVTMATGTFDGFHAKEVITMTDMRTAMESASKVMSAYSPPNR